MNIDRAFTILLQGFASYPFDVIANADTLIGQVVITAILSFALGLVLLRRGARRAWLMPPTFLIVTGIVEIVLKSVLVHPGPPGEFVRELGNPLGVHVATPSSFPSGHIARMTYLAVVASELWPARWVRASCVVLVVLTVLARIYLGDHWLSDAIGGTLLGLGAGVAAVWWMRRVSG